MTPRTIHYPITLDGLHCLLYYTLRTHLPQLFIYSVHLFPPLAPDYSDCARQPTGTLCPRTLNSPRAVEDWRPTAHCYGGDHTRTPDDPLQDQGLII